MNKEVSEEKTAEIARDFFLGEFSFDELEYVPANLSKDNKKELADLIIDYGDKTIAFQIKGRRGDPAPDGDKKWVERKINAAKNQLVNTLEQYSNYEIPQFINGKGDKCALKTRGTYIGIIILYNEAIEDYKRIVSCKRIDEQFHCFTYNDFKVCCEKLVIPRDIIEYLEFRKKIIQPDKICSADEELMAEEFLCGKYGTSNLDPHELDTFRWFLKTYQSRLVEGESDQYRNILQICLELDRVGIDAFSRRIANIIDLARNKKASDSNYIVPQDKNSSSFLFVASNGSDKEYIKRLMLLFMYKTKSNKCLCVVAYFENEDDIEFRLDWVYKEKDWKYDKLLEEICNSLEVKKKWNPALVLTHKVNK